MAGSLKRNKQKYVEVFLKVISELKNNEPITNNDLIKQLNKHLTHRYKLTTQQLPYLIKRQSIYRCYKCIHGTGMVINFIFVKVGK